MSTHAEDLASALATARAEANGYAQQAGALRRERAEARAARDTLADELAACRKFADAECTARMAAQAALALTEAALAEAQRVRDDCAAETLRLRARFAEGESWPLADVLDRLAVAGEHLMRDHDCDHHGWELVAGGVTRAREFAAAIRAALAPPASAEAPVMKPFEARASMLCATSFCALAPGHVGPHLGRTGQPLLVGNSVGAPSCATCAGVRLTTGDTCPECRRTGTLNDAKATCPDCNGRGEYHHEHVPYKCGSCGGSGVRR